MALGGYKFRGYHYTVPAGYDSSDDAQVKAQLLEMFRCRLKAFVDSCVLSGAEWEFSYTDGDKSFGTYGNVIYTLDSDGYNFGAFFKYRGKEQYMALVDYNSGSTQDGIYRGRMGSSNYIFDISYELSACGLAPYTPTNWNTAMPRRLNFRGRSLSTSVYSTHTPGVSAYYYGYATKGADVIEIIRSGLPDTNSAIKVMSPDGFSQLCDPSDVFPAFDFVSIGNFGSTSENPVWASRPPLQSLFSDGGIYDYAYSNTINTTDYYYLRLWAPEQAKYRAPVDIIPYAAPVITTGGFDGLPTIGRNGNFSKGSVKVELLAANKPFPVSQYSYVNVLKPYAGGNYLCIQAIYYVQYGAPAGNGYFHSVVYCGWDPSNPDVTQASAWTEYTPETAEEEEPLILD